MTPIEKIQRMIRPDELKTDEPLKWSAGTGTEVWEMFCAAISGDLQEIRRLLNQNPALVRCQYRYRTPLYLFCLRQHRRLRRSEQHP
jgi:hypothetical protein